MRSLLTFLLPVLGSSVAGAASAPPAQVYLYDPGTKPSTTQPESVDPSTARLIFSHRLGLSQFESIQDVQEKVINQLNAYGGLPRQLFGRDQQGTHEHGFIVVDGVYDPKDFIVKDRERYTTFQIANPPSSVTDLLSDLVEHAGYVEKETDSPWRNTYNAQQIAEVFRSFFNAEEHWTFTESRGPITFLSFGDLTAMEEKYGIKSNFYKDAQLRLQQAFDNLIELSRRENFSLTVLFMPHTAPQVIKRADDAWGVQRTAMPQKQQPELAQIRTATPSAKPASATSTAQTFAADRPLRGPIPTCFKKLEDCQASTRNCSSHGECILRYKSGDNACYGCACTIPVVRTNPDGSKKTTRFGGAACHKKDVVMPFWLFAGFSVLMMGLISYGVGMLYSMGNEELPSVIGAGVSGPRAK